MSKMISIGLNFSGVLLPLVDSEDGFQRVPMKPICEVVGIHWDNQHRKIQAPYFVRRMGICVGDITYAGQVRNMVLIRVDRVQAYLNTLNPDLIRAAGNVDSADWLEAKHAEWDDVLHAWESGHRAEVQGKITASLRRAGVIARVDSIKNPALQRLALREIGVNPDLLEARADGQGDLFQRTG